MEKYTEQIESVQEKIRQLKNRQKITDEKRNPMLSVRSGRAASLNAGPFLRAFSPRPCL